MHPGPPESFEDFKDSFSYGSRTDLSFKFLKHRSPDEAAAILARMLEATGALFDEPDPGRLIDEFVAAQAETYRRRPLADRYRYDGAPFVSPAKPVAAAKVALLTSSGHFVAGDDPRPFGVEDMSQEEAIDRIGDFLTSPPVLSTIPLDTPPDRLRVRHGGYDIRGARADSGVVFPAAVLRVLEAEGRVGSLVPDGYSFVGAAAQRRITRRAAPEWAAMLTQRGTDVAVLVPV